jgi:hypothetical protein
VPYVLTGLVDSPDRREPPPLVVAVNGTVAGVTGGYEPAKGGWRFSTTVGPFFVEGANDVAAYAISRSPRGITLHPVS